MTDRGANGPDPSPCSAMRPTALLATELGGGLGHVALLMPLARRLARRGFGVIIAAPDPASVAASGDWRVIQAPGRPPRSAEERRRRVPFRSFSDILFNSGLADPAHLRERAEAWGRILDEHRPDLVVANHCPFLQVAAFPERRVACVGTGFEVPPAEESFPILVDRPGHVGTLEAVFEAIAALQRARGRPVPNALTALFPGLCHFVLAVPELDPYAAHRRRGNSGPLESSPVPAATADQVFAYLSPTSPSCFRILAGLAQAKIPTRVVLAHQESVDRWRAELPALRIDPAPQAREEILRNCRVLVHHGGLSLSQEAAFAGIPQVVFPRYDEQRCNGAALKALGTGSWSLDPEPTTVARMVRRCFDDSELLFRSRAIGENLRARWPVGSADRIADELARLCA